VYTAEIRVIPAVTGDSQQNDTGTPTTVQSVIVGSWPMRRSTVEADGGG